MNSAKLAMLMEGKSDLSDQKLGKKKDCLDNTETIFLKQMFKITLLCFSEFNTDFLLSWSQLDGVLSILHNEK